MILLATPWPATEEALKEAGGHAGISSGKIIIDATNPLLPDLSGVEIGCSGEKVAEWARGASVVKAFNTIGANIIANPNFGDERVALFYCGDYEDAKKVVAGLISELGFDALDAAH